MSVDLTMFPEAPTPTNTPEPDEEVVVSSSVVVLSVVVLSVVVLSVVVLSVVVLSEVVVEDELSL